MSICEISRRTCLARNTIKKYLNSEEAEPAYPRSVSSKKPDSYAEKLAGIRGNKTSETAAQFEADLHKGEDQELIHNVSAFRT